MILTEKIKGERAAPSAGRVFGPEKLAGWLKKPDCACQSGFCLKLILYLTKVASINSV